MIDHTDTQAIPSGWYYVADTAEVARGAVVKKALFGQTLALWRSEAGVPHLHDAICPHLGSDLARLGKVKGEHLQCFSHRHEYDGAGDCVKAPRALPCLTRGVLRSWPVHEIGGFVLAWYDAAGRAPTWRIPDEVFDATGTSAFVKSQFEFECSVKTINEDNFDVGHLFNWHELSEVKSTLPVVDGHTISVVHDFKRHSILFKRPLPRPFDVLTREIVSRYGSTLYGHGLTYSFIDLPLFDFRTQDFIWSTPISATRTLYTTFLRRRLPTGPRTLRQRLVDKLVHPILFPMFVFRLRREHAHEGHGFWENQTRLTAPNVSAHERTMLEPYWRWCEQFDAPASGVAPAAAAS